MATTLDPNDRAKLREFLEQQFSLIADSLMLSWVNRVDLSRIKGVGEEYSDLLAAAGVDTVVELAQRQSANLYAKLIEVNQAKKRVRKLPTQTRFPEPNLRQ